MCDDLKVLQREISDLDNKARQHEESLLENSISADWFKEKARYDDVLFRLAQKKQKLSTARTGNIHVPETITLPARSNRNRGF